MVDPSFLHGHDLAVYSAGWCPDCKRLKHWVESNGVVVREISVETDATAAEKLERETGKIAVPYILVNGKAWVRGYHRELPGRFNPEVLVSELRAAIGP